jgi:hypothetical protein
MRARLRSLYTPKLRTTVIEMLEEMLDAVALGDIRSETRR